MKKNTFTVLILLFFTLMLTCCKSTDFTSQSEKLQLEGNPTTGYSWYLETSDDSVVKVSEDIKYLGEEGMTGAPSLYTWTLTSLKPGSTILTLQYKRWWEKTDEEEIRVYEVTVRENGKISIKESR